jgi:hypothetical protein
MLRLKPHDSEPLQIQACSTLYLGMQTSASIYVIPGRSRPDGLYEVYHVRQCSKVHGLFLFYIFKMCATKLDHLLVYSHFKNLQLLNIW